MEDSDCCSRICDRIDKNEAEYRGMLLGFDLLADRTRGSIIICGDYNLVIRQMRGEINFIAPGLKMLHYKALEKLRSWPTHEFLHMKIK